MNTHTVKTGDTYKLSYNVGTGMRASVMVHFAALNITGNINKILQAVAHIGPTIRGLAEKVQKL